MSKKKFSYKNFDFVKQSPKMMIGSAIFILIGILVIIFAGFNLGMEFTGGSVMELNTGAETTEKFDEYLGDIKNVMGEFGLKISTSQVEGAGANSSILIKFQDKKGATDEEMNGIIDELGEKLAQLDFLNADDINFSKRVGPSATSQLVMNATIAILFAIVLMLIYIMFRFEALSGISAIIALIHDVLIMCAVVAIFRLEVNSSFIAAIVTVIGYSINDTIVIFDKVRENVKNPNNVGLSNAEIVNMSIKQSFMKTLNTSITTFIAVFLIALIGVPSIREFIIPILFGVIAGTYSSLFIATPIWAMVNDRTEPRNTSAKLNSNK